LKETGSVYNLINYYLILHLVILMLLLLLGYVNTVFLLFKKFFHSGCTAVLLLFDMASLPSSEILPKVFLLFPDGSTGIDICACGTFVIPCIRTIAGEKLAADDPICGLYPLLRSAHRFVPGAWKHNRILVFEKRFSPRKSQH